MSPWVAQGQIERLRLSGAGVSGTKNVVYTSTKTVIASSGWTNRHTGSWSAQTLIFQYSAKCQVMQPLLLIATPMP